MIIKEKGTAYYKNIIKTNVELVGNVVEESGFLSGFTKSDYATMNKPFQPNDHWLLCLKFNLNSTADLQYLMAPASNYDGISIRVASGGRLQFYISGNGSSWNIANNKAGNVIFEANKDYSLYVSFNGIQYTFGYSVDGGETIIDTVLADSTPLYCSIEKYVLGINHNGSYPLNGTIDLNESYINIGDTRFWTGRELVSQRSTKADYDFTKEEDLYYAVKLDNKYHQISDDTNRVKTFIGGGTYSLNVLQEGDYLIEAISGGGSGGYTDGGTDKYSDTSYSYHYFANGGTGAYFKGYIHLTEGEHVINIGTNTIEIGEYGGAINIDDGFEMTGGLNGRCPTPLFKEYTTNTGGALTISTLVTSTLDYRVGTDRFLQNDGDGYKDNNSKDFSITPSVAPFNLSQYGFAGGNDGKNMFLGGNAYLQIKFKQGDIL